MQDPYKTLGVSREATQDEVRKAYLKLAHKYHPDKTGGDKEAENRLKEINASYDILKNPEKRAQFDRFGSEGNPFGGGGGFGGGQGGFEAPFEDFFDMLFGQGGRRRGGAQPGSDLELRLSISLEEAAFGCKKELRFTRQENCGECKGTGAAAGSRPETCSQCNGVGQVRVAHGFFSVTRTCPKCRGAGKVISRPCKVCNGSGRTKETRTISVDIPAGVDTGSRMRISGEGEPGGPGSPRGDLYVLLEVQPHPLFQRENTHLICEFPINIVQAAVGATVRVPTLKGEVDLKIPAGTQSGALLRLRGFGIPDLRGYSQGDQVVKVIVETPSKLSKKQRELLEEFERLSDPKTYPLHAHFSDKVKKAK
jgi:molecular chaperone DnaJ